MGCLTPRRRLGSRARCNTAEVGEGVAMGRRGRKRQLEVQARYWQLLQFGVGTVAACRQVGISRKTGYRWRAGVGGLAPVRLGEAVRSNRYLSLLERARIAALRGQGVGVGEIARRLDRSPSTVSRELRRNTAAHDRGRYDAPGAHARARARGTRPVGPGWRPTLRCALWCRRSWRSSGARSRSPRT